MKSFTSLHQPTDRVIHIDHQDYLFFGGTAYLGLLVNKSYQALVMEGIRKYGLNNGTSRSNNVQLGIYNEAEAGLALRFGYPSSALFSSGYLAAQAAVRCLAKGKIIYYAPGSHPALWLDDKPMVLGDGSMTDWITTVVDKINNSSEVDFLLVANAIDNLKPERYDFNALSGVDYQKKVTLLLDDSHGLGVVNKNAISAQVDKINSKSNIELVVVASLAKGLGTDSGIVMGNVDTIAEIKKSPIFMGASPTSPGFIYALLHSEGIYHEAFTQLHENIHFVKEQIKDIESLEYASGFPVFTSTDPSLYQKILDKGLLISSFPYPLPASPLLNRVVISALHTSEDLLRLTDVLHSCVE